MSPWDYAADPLKPYLGELIHNSEGDHLKVLTVGQLAERKGIVPAAQQIAAWAETQPDILIQWNIVGSGPLENKVRKFRVPKNLEIILHGHCDPDAIRNQYRDNHVLLFPTLADEWGLVVDEALFSGLPVIGSCYSQAVMTLIRDGINGRIYDPTRSDSLAAAFHWWTSEGVSHDDRRREARKSVRNRTPSASAEQLIRAIESACTMRGQKFTRSHAETNICEPLLSGKEIAT
jgi:glycosyltransferase involved in cell wall biosynthesis